MNGKRYAMHLDQNRASWQYSFMSRQTMTFETIDAILDEPMMTVREEPAEAAPSLKVKVQPWLKTAIGVICLTQGLRLLHFSDPIATLTGFGLLIPVPSCFYLGWRDYLGLQKGPTPRTAVPACDFRQAA